MIEKLLGLGFNRYEARAYLVLLENGVQRASEVARKARVPQQKVYEALYALVDKGFCQIVSSRVRRFAAVEPTLALSAYMSSVQESHRKEIEVRTQRIAASSEYLSKMFDRQRQSNPQSIGIIKGSRLAGEWFTKNFVAAREQSAVMERPPYAMPCGRMMDVLAKSRLRRGRILVQTLDNTEHLAAYRELARTSRRFEVRVMKTLPMKLALFDGRSGMLSLAESDGAETELTGLVFEHAELHSAFRTVFEEHWSRAHVPKVAKR